MIHFVVFFDQWKNIPWVNRSGSVSEPVWSRIQFFWSVAALIRSTFAYVFMRFCNIISILAKLLNSARNPFQWPSFRFVTTEIFRMCADYHCACARTCHVAWTCSRDTFSAFMWQQNTLDVVLVIRCAISIVRVIIAPRLAADATQNSSRCLR